LTTNNNLNLKNIVVLSGAGISAESGISTFRDTDGLWENHRIEEVATYDAWLQNPELVIKFYNERRKQLFQVSPNPAHLSLQKLEKKYNVTIVTQNIDDLHERANSTNVLHLHGKLKQLKSTVDDSYIIDLDHWEHLITDKCPNGLTLRPNIVWFGEQVPAIEKAVKIVSNADVLIIVGTSLNVYPAAGLIDYTKSNCKIYLVDPKADKLNTPNNIKMIKEKAGIGIPKLVEELLKDN